MVPTNPRRSVRELYLRLGNKRPMHQNLGYPSTTLVNPRWSANKAKLAGPPDTPATPARQEARQRPTSARTPETTNGPRWRAVR
jgi:hypothetical protein